MRGTRHFKALLLLIAAVTMCLAAAPASAGTKASALAPATRITMAKTKTVTAGLPSKLTANVVNSGERLAGHVFRSSDTKIATVTEKTGIIKGRRAGKCTISCTLKNGKTWKCALTVKPNSFTYTPYNKIRFTSAAAVQVHPVRVFFSGDQMNVIVGVKNGLRTKLLDFTSFTFDIKGSGGSLIYAAKLSSATPVNLNPGAKKQVTVHFSTKGTKRCRLSQYKDLGYNFRYYYTCA